MDKEKFRERLYYAMSLRGKRAVDLCKDLGIPKSTISQYLSGKSKGMTADRLNAISKYLNVSEAWLMGYDVQMDRVPESLIDLAKAKTQDDMILDLFHQLNDDGKAQAMMQLKVLTMMDDFKENKSG